jgi:hypothetical protein
MNRSTHDGGSEARCLWGDREIGAGEWMTAKRVCVESGYHLGAMTHR